jgi:hypothetical protein
LSDKKLLELLKILNATYIFCIRTIKSPPRESMKYRNILPIVALALSVPMLRAQEAPVQTAETRATAPELKELTEGPQITRGELQLKEATLYTTFRRLESAGVIESYWGDERAGARRRYYHLTDAGRKLYEENQEDWRKYRAIISQLFGMEDGHEQENPQHD